jgi:hypothetical protein
MTSFDNCTFDVHCVDEDFSEGIQALAKAAEANAKAIEAIAARCTVNLESCIKIENLPVQEEEDEDTSSPYE